MDKTNQDDLATIDGESGGDQLDLFAAPSSGQSMPVAMDTPRAAISATSPSAPVSRAVPIAELRVDSRAADSLGMADAGDELVANRRNRSKLGTTWADVEGLNDALKVKGVIKANVWPKPDYKALIDAGTQPLIANVLKQVYDSVASKPAVRSGVPVTDATLQRYIAGLQRIEEGVNRWTQDSRAMRAWALQSARVAGGMLGREIAVSDLGPTTSLLEYVYPDGWRAHRDEMTLVGGNRVLGALQPGYEEIARGIKAIDKGWPNKRESWEIQGFKIMDRPEAHIGVGLNGKHLLQLGHLFVDAYATDELAREAAAAIKPIILIGKRGFVESYDTYDSAVDAARERALGAKAKTGSISEKGAAVADAERVGVSRRLEGEDISSARLMQEFGLRGVNFGNWMKTPAARVEAQLHLNHAFDAMHDLADILDVPPKALGLGGMLGLAFGAQGHGGKNAAHFVPGVNEINLTRATGAGALAHEWAHAVDHYFAQQAGLGTDENPFLSEHASLGATRTRYELQGRKFAERVEPRFGAIRPEIVAAFNTTVLSMTKRPQTLQETRDQEAAGLQRTDKNINGWLASIRRDFSGVEAAYDVLAERVRTRDLGGERVAIGSSTLVHPVVSEMRDLYKATRGRVYKIDSLKSLQSNIDSREFGLQRAEHTRAMGEGAELVLPPPRQVSTEYAANAAKLDRDKGGKPYWSTKCELFARAFDSFVADRLEARGARNSYLSFGVRENPTVPLGAERESVNAAFETLVDEFAVRDTELGPALFSKAAQHRASMPRGDMDAEIQRLRGQWKGMPPVFVVDSVADLPFKMSPNADGVYHAGKVYVIADVIADVAQLQKVMAHECVMHHSLEQMLGHYGFSKLHHGVQSLKANGDEAVCSIAANVRERYGDLPPDIETKEIVARAGEMCLDGQGNVKVQYGFMKGVFAGVTGWLRDHGITVPFTNTELQGILHNAGEWARSGPVKAPMVKRMATELQGLFVGKILSAVDGVVTQRVGRDAAPVLHSMADLSGPVEVGAIAEIVYDAGKGTVRTPGQAHQRDVSR